MTGSGIYFNDDKKVIDHDVLQDGYERDQEGKVTLT
jgi:hypothetical protein